MSKLHPALERATAVAAIVASASLFALPPPNPDFEAYPDLDTWSVVDIGDYSGGGDVIRGDGQAVQGEAYGRVSFRADYAFGETAWGPALASTVFSAGTGEELSLYWRVEACGNPLDNDEALARGYIVDAFDDTPVATFFDYGPDCGTAWALASATVPVAGDYYLLLQVGSFDATGGGVIGAELHIDNIFSSNLPPDCIGAEASPDSLWPPNHRYHDIEILGVTDPDGDAVEIIVDAVFQDEPTNSYDDGDTCPDAEGIGSGTARVRAERVGGEWGFEGDGRVYRIEFTATDEFGASCQGHAKVAVPHDRKALVDDDGPMFDSTVCP